ncbi:hypothetical protein A4G99_03080 [Haladaptatus sp. R4]|uniref:hypothetical protein n=1 Tax=Haladaptatus sp. R4 TaxID=1679489 RepID=UPI0007B4C2A4|nr:hypothetical protein [Haladaptatus sp. R4]KZN25484.1 hypothetical protein A4G99_03080 [Haladaptatus sp. R4]
MGTPLPTETGEVDRWRAMKAVVPFLALGLIDLVLILGWGLNPLWGFAILPPMIFISVLAWISFKSGFIDENASAEYYEGE